MPYHQTLYLDCDTTIHGALNGLFPREEEIVLTPIQYFFSDDPKQEEHYRAWGAVCPELVSLQKSRRYPVINAGVIGFPRQQPIYAAWQELLARNQDPVARTPEEMALQFLYPQYRHRFMRPIYNYWPKHGAPETAVINHYYCEAFQFPPYKKMLDAIKEELLTKDVAQASYWCQFFPKSSGGRKDLCNKYYVGL